MFSSFFFAAALMSTPSLSGPLLASVAREARMNLLEPIDIAENNTVNRRLLLMQPRQTAVCQNGNTSVYKLNQLRTKLLW